MQRLQMLNVGGSMAGNTYPRETQLSDVWSFKKNNNIETCPFLFYYPKKSFFTCAHNNLPNVLNSRIPFCPATSKAAVQVNVVLLILLPGQLLRQQHN